MATTAEQILTAAVKLPDADRTEWIEALVDSVGERNWDAAK